jgi:hypothetical protein
MGLLEDIERMTTEVYGKGSAVSVDSQDGGWVIRCWDRKGVQKDSSVSPLPKHKALARMKRLLTRASFLRLDEDDETSRSADSGS